ncbi:NYN domain-containing protein [uncultured Tateyamaria sp.]|uniref:NYN domain-containing protein n=1 Tax=uncultured Tateyamaria sp. TaxID=455651 RepID=UPI00261204BA|nr:NYN domain-containing protein [uncultured Tateyamaria sp.]
MVDYDEAEPVGRRPHFAFVDADNLFRGFSDVLSRAKAPSDLVEKLDISAVVPYEFDRIYLYHAAKSDQVLPRWLKNWREQDGVILRLGRTTNKRNVTKQEGVDVQLAIEALRYSYRSIMQSCTLYSEDGDFLPLVDELVSNGTFVTVSGFSSAEIGDVTPAFRDRSDRYRRITNEEILGTFSPYAGPRKVHSSQRIDLSDAVSLKTWVGETVTVLSQSEEKVKVYIPPEPPRLTGYVRLFPSIEHVHLWSALKSTRSNDGMF